MVTESKNLRTRRLWSLSSEGRWVRCRNRQLSNFSFSALLGPNSVPKPQMLSIYIRVVMHEKNISLGPLALYGKILSLSREILLISEPMISLSLPKLSSSEKK